MSTYEGQQILMTGHSHSILQGAYVMDSSFSHGTYVDRRSNLTKHDTMIQVNKYLMDDSCHVGRCQKLECNDKSHILGQRCQILGCPDVVSNGLALCIFHGGGHPRVDTGISVTTSEAQIKNEGNRFRNTGSDANALHIADICNADGQVVMCKHEGCSKRAQGNTTFCKVHSGVSKRCMVHGCTKGAHGGTPLCIGHGGGKRCVVTGCPNAACGNSQGRTDCCVRHGGGRRCNYDGCSKGAQGNTDFCIAHGGGRRCKYEGCGKSAQGRTDYCIKHGGGKRCMFEGCSTSAKWGKDFCSVHRKSLSQSNLINDVPPAPPAPPLKRRAKKAKITIKTPDSFREVSTMSAITGSVMPKMAVVDVAAAGSKHDKSPDNSIRRHPTVVRLQPLPSSTESLQLGFQLHGFSRQ